MHEWQTSRTGIAHAWIRRATRPVCGYQATKAGAQLRDVCQACARWARNESARREAATKAA